MSIKIFHLHFFIKDVEKYENFFVNDLKLKVKGIFGSINNEKVSLNTNTKWNKINDNSFKLRLIELERGALNIVLMPSKYDEPVLEHIGILGSEEEINTILDLSNENNLKIRENTNRIFLSTPFALRIELHIDTSERYKYSDNDFEECRIEKINFTNKNHVEQKKFFLKLFSIENTNNYSLELKNKYKFTLTFSDGENNISSFNILENNISKEIIL